MVFYQRRQFANGDKMERKKRNHSETSKQNSNLCNTWHLNKCNGKFLAWNYQIFLVALLCFGSNPLPSCLCLFGAFPWPIHPAADICISFSSPTSFISNLDRVQACLPQLHIYCVLLYMSQKLPFSHTCSQQSVLLRAKGTGIRVVLHCSGRPENVDDI